MGADSQNPLVRGEEVPYHHGSPTLWQLALSGVHPSYIVNGYEPYHAPVIYPVYSMLSTDIMHYHAIYGV